MPGRNALQLQKPRKKMGLVGGDKWEFIPSGTKTQGKNGWFEKTRVLLFFFLKISFFLPNLCQSKENSNRYICRWREDDVDLPCALCVDRRRTNKDKEARTTNNECETTNNSWWKCTRSRSPQTWRRTAKRRAFAAVDRAESTMARTRSRKVSPSFLLSAFMPAFMPAFFLNAPTHVYKRVYLSVGRSGRLAVFF